MGITSKDLASLLNLSEAAVSLALRGKQGVSTATRNRVLQAAEKNGFDFTRLHGKTEPVPVYHDPVYLVMFRNHGAVVADTPFFSSLCEGIETSCKLYGHRLCIYHIEGTKNIRKSLEQIQSSGCVGIILLATEMRVEDFEHFSGLHVPMVLLDAYFDTVPYNSVTINNQQGAYLATNHLIDELGVHPGYLHSSYSIRNFEERTNGFFRSVREHGLSSSRTVVHLLAPSAEGAMADMAALLKNGEKPQRAYFADNDLIALGAMRALLSAGYRIPQDVALVGFDNILAAEMSSPPLTTINVPKEYMGMTVMNRLEEILRGSPSFQTNIALGTSLIRRGSVR